MKLGRILLTAALLASLLGTGCTVALWRNEMINSWNEPATDSHIRLYQSPRPEKILVIYDEYSERHDAMHTRAFWLDERQAQPEHPRTPHFVSTNSAADLAAIPVFLSPPEPSNLPPLYAIAATNGQSFTLYSHGTKMASHELPSYNDGTGEVEKVLLTPVTIASDLTILGAVLGYFYVAGQAPGLNPSY